MEERSIPLVFKKIHGLTLQGTSNRAARKIEDKIRTRDAATND
jgi:hypothetical protein